MIPSNPRPFRSLLSRPSLLSLRSLLLLLCLSLLFSLLWLLSLPAFSAPPSSLLPAPSSLTKSPDSLLRRALMLEHGDDSIAARSLLRKAADLGSSDAMNILGMSYVDGSFGLKLSPDSAVRWLRLSADAGNPRAANNLAFLLLNPPNNASPLADIPLSQADFIAVSYLERAVKDSLPSAAAMLGDLLLIGRGVSPDTLRATQLYHLAADKGFPEAEIKWCQLVSPQWESLSDPDKMKLALRFYNGRFPYSAIFLASQIAEKHSSPDSVESLDDLDAELYMRALELLADAAANGRGRHYSHTDAMDYYYRAAMAGSAPAAFILAETLEFFPDALKNMNTVVNAELLHEIASYGGIRSSRQARNSILAPLE